MDNNKYVYVLHCSIGDDKLLLDIYDSLETAIKLLDKSDDFWCRDLPPYSEWEYKTTIIDLPRPCDDLIHEWWDIEKTDDCHYFLDKWKVRSCLH